MLPLVYPAIDLVIGLVFAAIGRRNHGEGDALTGILMTAWPFLGGILIGWVIVVALRRSLAEGARFSNGIVVWLSTVVFGMLLRHVEGRGVAISFIIVTLIFNGLMMLGWRAVLAWKNRRAQA